MSNPIEKRGAIIPLGWPEMTARGSERIWDYLRKLGIIKNVNLLVGHAGMIVVQHDKLEYFDFGRYITPKTMGRARSSRTDPKLRLKTTPEWDSEGKLLNLVGILQELENNSEATHGEGPIYATVYYDADIEKVLEYAYSIQDLGFVDLNWTGAGNDDLHKSYIWIDECLKIFASTDSEPISETYCINIVNKQSDKTLTLALNDPTLTQEFIVNYMLP